MLKYLASSGINYLVVIITKYFHAVYKSILIVVSRKPEENCKPRSIDNRTIEHIYCHLIYSRKLSISNVCVVRAEIRWRRIAQYLGLVLDQKQAWWNHIDILNKIFFATRNMLMLLLYTVIARLVLLYGSRMWKTTIYPSI